MDEHPVVFDPRAEADVEAAADWYEEQTPGLGLGFVTAVETVIDRVAAKPDVYQEVARGIRRALLARFPFSLYYQSNSTHITVLAVLHTRREPSAWKNRI